MCYAPLNGYLQNFKINGIPKRKVKILGNRYAKTDEGKEPNIKVACGKCMSCRLNYSRQWSIRSMLEAQLYENNYFINLTYNNENIPLAQNYDPITGQVALSGTLQKKHITKFMKDLRAYYKYHYNHDNIRFIACGEYGPSTKRPHYHMIIFNLPINDLKYFQNNTKGKTHYTTYTSEIISNIWKKGFILIGETTFQSAGYVAQYVLKKQNGSKQKKHPYVQLEDEFFLTSRNPGIGRQYYEEHKDEIYKDDYIFVNTQNGVKKSLPPKYFDNLYKVKHEEYLYKLKSKRLDFMLENTKQIQMEMDYEDYLFNENLSKSKKVDIINKREDI